MFAPVIVLAFVTNNGIVISALAVGSGSSGQVIQEAVNTSNPELDKQVNKFYECVSTNLKNLVKQKLITAIFRYLEEASTIVAALHCLQMNRR
jgi:hypothetical protein